jgi:predicted nucleotidyltransferase
MNPVHIPVSETAIAQFCRSNGIRKLAFFGSVITDRFRDSSDIDVLVDFRPGRTVGFFRLAGMEEQLRHILGDRKVDLLTAQDLSVYFRDEVVRNAVVAYAEP